MRYTIEGNTLIKYEKETSKLRIGGGSWTVKDEFIKNESIQTLTYITRKFKYIIEKTDAIKNGFYRTLGGELKLVVPINHWTVVNV